MDTEYYRNDARNTVWALAFVAFIPALVIALMAVQGPRIKWDDVTVGVLAYSVALSLFASVAGVLCGRGSKTGRWLAFTVAILLLPRFPLGTLFAVATIVKVSRREFNKSLR